MKILKNPKLKKIISSNCLFYRRWLKYSKSCFFVIGLFLIAIAFLRPICEEPPIPQLTCEIDYASDCMPDWSLFRKEINSVQISTDSGYVNRDIVVTEDEMSLSPPDTLVAIAIEGEINSSCDWWMYMYSHRNASKDMYLCGVKYILYKNIVGSDTFVFIQLGLTWPESPSQGFSSVAVYQVDTAAYNGDGQFHGDKISVLRTITAHELGGQLWLETHNYYYPWDCIMVQPIRWDGLGQNGLLRVRDTVFCSTCRTGMGENNP